MQLKGIAFSKLRIDVFSEQESKSDFLILDSLSNTAKRNKSAL